MPDILTTSLTALTSAIFGATASYWYSLCQEKRRIKQEKRNILHSLKAELIAIQALINVRKNDILNDVENNSPEETTTYSFIYLPTSYNYFTVYDNLSSKLGLIDDKILVTKIICSYADIKGLWENVKDLEFVAKKGMEISISTEDTSMHKKAILSHYDYVNFIITRQLPIVETAIYDCITHIDKELSTLK